MSTEHTRVGLASVNVIDFREEVKPKLRGWSHAVGFVAAIVATVLLLLQTYGDLPRFLALLVFGTSLICLYLFSALYHLGNWQGRQEEWLLALDHAGIFLLIAGTYTPICAVVFNGWLRVALLAVIWLLAAIGIATSLTTLRVPRWALAALYVGMGWIAVGILPELARQLSLEAVLMLLAGGLSYTVGAIIYTFGRPDPIPHIFGFHELFHLFVLGGSVATTAMIWVWIVPFGQT